MLVLTTGRARGSLVAVRALGRAGWRVGVATPSGDGLAARSTWCRAVHRVPRPRRDGRAFVSAVTDAVRAGRYDLVVGGADDWAAALAHFGDEIPCSIGHPDGKVVTRAIDKYELSQLADVHGLRAPRTCLATPERLATMTLPVVVKCRTHWVDGVTAEQRIEASLHHDRVSAAAAARRIAAAGLEPLLQEPVTGRLSALIGVVVDGRLRGRVAQTADGTWPTPYGASSRARTALVDEELAGRVERLLQDLEWSGLVELQFLRPDHGEPALIDLNGRYFGSMALSLAAGVDLPDAAARIALGRDPGPLSDGRPGVRYLWVAGDLRRAWVERRGGLVRDLVSGLVEWGRADALSVLTWHDLRPLVWLAGDRFRGRG